MSRLKWAGVVIDQTAQDSSHRFLEDMHPYMSAIIWEWVLQYKKKKKSYVFGFCLEGRRFYNIICVYCGLFYWLCRHQYVLGTRLLRAF